MDNFVAREHQRQAVMNVTVRNITASMRRISAIDWGEVFGSKRPTNRWTNGPPWRILQRQIAPDHSAAG